MLPGFPRCWPGQPGSINTPARGLAARRSQAAPVPVTAAPLSLPVPPAPAPRHPDTRSCPQPLPAFRNICHSHGRLKIKAENRESKGSLGVGATARISRTMHAEAPTPRSGQGQCRGAGLCLPRHPRGLSPTRGKVPAAGKWQEYSKANSPGALAPARAAGPRSLPRAARSREEEEEETEEERETGCERKVGPARDERKNWMGRGGELGEQRGPSTRQPPTTELQGGASLGVRAAGEIGETYLPPLRGASAAGWGKQPPVAGAAD